MAAGFSSAPLCCQIDPSLENMDKLHKKYGWIPDRHHIRPSPAVLERKQRHMLESGGVFDVEEWSSLKFGCSWSEAQRGGSTLPYFFEQNAFPYDVPEGTHHWVLWFPSATALDAAQVTHQCADAVELYGGRNFVWYTNPKMTVPDIYHVQVFWRQ